MTKVYENKDIPTDRMTYIMDRLTEAETEIMLYTIDIPVAEHNETLKLSAQDHQACFEAKRFCEDNPSVIGSDSGVENFVKALAVTAKLQKIQERIDHISFAMLSTRLASNHTQKWFLTELYASANKNYQKGKTLWYHIYDVLAALFVKSNSKNLFELPIAPLAQIVIENAMPFVAFVNSGTTMLRVYRGAAVGLEYFDLEPGTSNLMPEYWNTILVVNQSDAVVGKFKVRIKGE